MNCIRDSHYQFSWKDEFDDEPVAPPVLDPLPDDPHLLLDSTMMVNGWPTFCRTNKPNIPNLEACIQKLERTKELRRAPEKIKTFRQPDACWLGAETQNWLLSEHSSKTMSEQKLKHSGWPASHDQRKLRMSCCEVLGQGGK